ncbi:alpha/beta hydrolase [Microbacterium sp. NPDC089698]|uniref:alpha/beta hydrolase n=1 Tax=Microbacterium sp. NPDC089698 TaxID=3364200 RepID=UPI0038241E24
MIKLADAASSAAGHALKGLSLRIVSATRRRRPVTAHGLTDGVVLPKTSLTGAPGEYGLWFGPDFSSHAVLGEVLVDDGRRVRREVKGSSVPLGKFKAHMTGHIANRPEDVGLTHSEVTIPTSDGQAFPAWHFAGDPNRWVIHVQGIRTSRALTLRTVGPVSTAGLTSLSIAYRGAGDGPPQATSTLGLTEWRDVADAITFARTRGARDITLVGWSMGAGIALETARRHPDLVDRLVLICPATNWRPIIAQGAKTAGLPPFVAKVMLWLLSSRGGSSAAGLPEPLDFDLLNWTRPGALHVPALVIHTSGDEEIPLELSRAFANAHPSHVTLVETAAAPHGWEQNADPARFNRTIQQFLFQDYVDSES